jgi:Uma2 family endonuclease
MSAATPVFPPPRPSRPGEPVWELLDSFPRQGDWTVEEYLRLPEDGRLIEFNDGTLEAVPMPDWIHQELAGLLWWYFRGLKVGGETGHAVLPPFHLQTGKRKYRHPDVMYLLSKHKHQFSAQRWTYADLVVEVVSKDDPARDHEVKRAEYAAAGVPEYWIVDPTQDLILVLTLDNGAYVEASRQPLRSVVQSATIAEAQVDFASLMEQAMRGVDGQS